MSAFLRIVSRAPGAVPMTVVDGPPFTPWVLVGVKDLGSVKWANSFAGARGTQGRRAVGGTIEDRVVTFGLLSQDHADKDELHDSLSALAVVIDELRRFGGTVTFREHNQTRRQHLDVLAADAGISDWSSAEYELRDAQRPAITLTCAPYLLGDPMDHDDDFATDHVNAGDAIYVADAGALTNLAVSGGQLNGSLNLSTENRLIHMAADLLGDHEAQVRFSPGSTITSLKGGVVLKRIDASNFLEVYVDDNGTNSRLRVDKVVAGTRTNLSSTNLAARMVVSMPVTVRGRIENNVVYATHHADRELSFATATGTTNASIALTSAEIAVFGIAVSGRAGFTFTPQHASAYVDRFIVRPWTYREAAGSSETADVLHIRGTIPGDAPAACDVWVNQPSPNPLSFAMLAWAPTTIFNRLQNGSFDTTNGSAVTPWSSAAVTGVTGAATSIGITSTAKFGTYSGTVTTPATANVGVHYPIYQRFYAGITYTARIWVRSATATTLARLRLGVSGDIASSAAVAISPTWTLHTVTWTPTASVALAYLAFEQTAATAGTFSIDGAAVYEGTVAPSHGAHIEGDGGHPPLAVIAGADNISATGTLSVIANGSSKSDYLIRDSSVAAGGESYETRHVIDASLIGPDDYSGDEIAVEVWGRFYMHSAFTGGAKFTLRTVDRFGTLIGYSIEHGQAGKTVPAIGNDGLKTYRLGTVILNTADAVRWVISVQAQVFAGTNLQQFGLDCLYVIIRRSRALTVTGKPAAGYPKFFPTSGLSTKVIASADLSGTLTSTTEGVRSRGSGLSGSPIELPPGAVDFFAIVNSREIDDPVQFFDDSETYLPDFHLAITPRFHWPRGS